jgi:hypothetical protein
MLERGKFRTHRALLAICSCLHIGKTLLDQHGGQRQTAVLKRINDGSLNQKAKLTLTKYFSEFVVLTPGGSD